MRPVTGRSLWILLAASAAAPGVAHARPWEAREPSVDPKPAHQLKNPATVWPAEPEMPAAPIDAAKFTAAWVNLCGLKADSPVAALAPKIIAAAAAAKSDPFTLAALARFGSRCDPAYKGKKGGTYGLLAIEPGMYRVPGAPELPVDKADLTSKRLLDPEVNLAVGAALLEMWQTTHKEIDAAFGGAPHRTGVAHFMWGDVVRSSGHEDLVLTMRRRIIDAYGGQEGCAPPGPVRRDQRGVAAGGDAAGGAERSGRRSFGRQAPPRRARHRGHDR